MNEKVFDFNEQERRGKEGELDIIKAWPNLFKWSDVNEYDLIYTANNKTVEVKTEVGYTLKKTQNFFMEKYSNNITYKYGGPWRARKDNVDIFISYFIQDKTLFWFDDVKSLVNKCEEGIREYNLSPRYIKNKGYYTVGFPIKRHWFKALFRVIKLGEKI